MSEQRVEANNEHLQKIRETYLEAETLFIQAENKYPYNHLGLSPILEEIIPDNTLINKFKKIGGNVLSNLYIDTNLNKPEFRTKGWEMKPYDGFEIVHDLDKKRIDVLIEQASGFYYSKIIAPVLFARLSESEFTYDPVNAIKASDTSGDWCAPLAIPVHTFAEHGDSIDDKLKTFGIIIKSIFAYGNTGMKLITDDGHYRSTRYGLYSEPLDITKENREQIKNNYKEQLERILNS